jgi:hypothetical protein
MDIVHKNKLIEFRDHAARMVARHPDAATKFLAWAYGIGDGLIVSIPLVRNGFFQTVLQAKPDWRLLAAAYAHDPVPVVVSAVFVAGSVIIGKGRFALGHAGYGVGGVALAANLFVHHQPWTAAAILPTIVGGVVGASYKHLERKYAHSKNSFVRLTLGSPKQMAGICFSVTSVPTVITSMHEKVWSLVGSGLCWFAGNLTSMLLPHDHQ